MELRSFMRFVFAAAILAGVGLSQWSQARAEQVVLVELFTSQGCSSCPPADAHFGELAQQDNVVALAFHVDYWDYLGWSDTFADPAFADRQRTYAPRVDRSHIGRALRGSFTPEMVVQGTESLIGSMRKTVGSRVAAHAAGMPKARLDLSRVGGGIRVDVDTSGRPAKAARVMLARYTAEASAPVQVWLFEKYCPRRRANFLAIRGQEYCFCSELN